ncbi:hypothetical protein EAG_06412 [Camponotus floridanus]|uniref:Uncharacterized protein n=1 Tax=Camponotus floridanus TaxID=104421 RepID=E2B033_CAMFO|nr:hypothetical protein EAG_06412 [Camponotus floridanus]
MGTSLIQDTPNIGLLHDDVIRILPLDEAYPRSPCPCHHLKPIRDKEERYQEYRQHETEAEIHHPRDTDADHDLSQLQMSPPTSSSQESSPDGTSLDKNGAARVKVGNFVRA